MPESTRPRFVTTPTPVEPAPRLAQEIGLRSDQLLIKRDDLIGLGGGGNKARKLEISMGDALAAGAREVVTTGAPQSNHARLTAAAGARLGLHVVLVLGGRAPAAPVGNLLLDALFGAEVVFSDDRDPEQVADRITAERRAHRIPFGGSTARTAEAYSAAGLELLEQVPDVGVVVVAIGSGGTMAGLVHALGTSRVLGVATGAVEDSAGTVAAFVREMGGSADGLRVDLDQVGAGYEHVTAATTAALLLTARTEGVVLDPTYTGRAMAALITRARAGSLGDRPVVFLHTGGLPSLFAHSEIVAPSRTSV